MQVIEVFFAAAGLATAEGVGVADGVGVGTGVGAKTTFSWVNLTFTVGLE